jgi:hypothetical protein
MNNGIRTIVILAGNSDDRLKQRDWSVFVGELSIAVGQVSETVHFFGGSDAWSPWQNVCWVVEIEEAHLKPLAGALTEIRKRFRQESIVWISGETKFI